MDRRWGSSDQGPKRRRYLSPQTHWRRWRLSPSSTSHLDQSHQHKQCDRLFRARLLVGWVLVSMRSNTDDDAPSSPDHLREYDQQRCTRPSCTSEFNAESNQHCKRLLVWWRYVGFFFFSFAVQSPSCHLRWYSEPRCICASIHICRFGFGIFASTRRCTHGLQYGQSDEPWL